MLIGGFWFWPGSQPFQVVTHADDPSVGALAAAVASVPPPAPCVEGGASGRRVQLFYARVAGDADAYTGSVPTIREAAAQVNAAWRSVADKDIRWRCNAQGAVSVGSIVVTSYTIDACKAALQSHNIDRTDRIYVCFMRTSAKGYGGQAQIVVSDAKTSPSPHDTGPRYAAIYSISAGTSPGTLMHEFGHTIGAVQCSAPHSSCPANELGHHHCYEESDTMCYSDGGSYFLRAGTIINRCLTGVSTLAGRWDCGKDDYFNSNPASGSYLASHWNTYNSLFLWPN